MEYYSNMCAARQLGQISWIKSIQHKRFRHVGALEVCISWEPPSRSFCAFEFPAEKLLSMRLAFCLLELKYWFVGVRLRGLGAPFRRWRFWFAARKFDCEGGGCFRKMEEFVRAFSAFCGVFGDNSLDRHRRLSHRSARSAVGLVLGSSFLAASAE